MRLLPRLLFALVVVGLLLVGLAVRRQVGAGPYLFAGSDSYGYDKLANEVLLHQRYALGPAPVPRYWSRPPGYPLYVALLKGRANAAMGSPAFALVARGNVFLELLGTGLLLCFAVHRFAGAGPALLALLLMMIGPWNAFATPAALTETLATFFVTATVAVLIPPAMGSRRLGWLAAAGVCFALGMLSRPDTLLLAPALLVGLFVTTRARAPAGQRLRAAAAPVAALALGFCVVFLPWPVRNLLAFGAPHPLGGRVDRYARPVEHWEGNWSFLGAISRDWQAQGLLTTCYHDVGCHPTVEQFVEVDPSLDASERAAIARVLERRLREGASLAVSEDFAALARARARARPMEVALALPLSRLRAMWIADHDELVLSWSPVHRFVTHMRSLSRVLVGSAALGALLLLIDRRRRWVGIILVSATLGRTAILAWGCYSMPRYALESVPCAFALIAGGLAVMEELARRIVRSSRWHRAS